MNKNWVLLLFAGFMEILWVTGIKYSSNAWMWIGTIIVLIISFDLLIRVTKQLPVGTVYAVFTGLGTAGTVAVEMIWFHEPFELLKVVLILLLLIGVIGLKAITKPTEKQGAER